MVILIDATLVGSNSLPCTFSVQSCRPHGSGDVLFGLVKEILSLFVSEADTWVDILQRTLKEI